MLHIGHRDQPSDARDAKPLQYVRHELLEARVLHAGYALRPRKIGCSLVTARLSLACVVHQKLGDFTERASFFAVVDDEPRAAGLRFTHAFFDAVRQVRTAGADVRTEDVRAIALIVNTAGELPGRVMNGS